MTRKSRLYLQYDEKITTAENLVIFAKNYSTRQEVCDNCHLTDAQKLERNELYYDALIIQCSYSNEAQPKNLVSIILILTYC